QFPFFPQYIVLYILGVAAYRHDWLGRIPSSMGRLWLVVAAMMILIVLPGMFLLGGGTKGNVEPFKGGLHVQALALAFWEQLTGVAMVVGLAVWFRDRFNRQSALLAAAAKSSYTAYIIHAPVIILYALTVRSVALPVLPKFTLAVLITVPLCFGLGNLIRKLPGARKIL
ncbi:MAG: acyltransferase family protein, partial [Sedimentisphaerales bacterium]|nr:acyltransferase family protein [Sedimentisphaerales bacterium]